MVAILSQDVASEFEKRTKIKTIALPRYERLDAPVSSHADMLLCVLENRIFIYSDYYNENKELFNPIKGYRIVPVQKECKKEYPNDIGLNVLIIGKKIFCNIDNTAKEILSFAKEQGYEIIHVKQGYSACSTLVIDEKNALTGDNGMYKSLTENGVNTLLISPVEIKLDGYNHGFIGGSVGIFAKKAYFSGDVSTLSDGEKIVEFLKSSKCEIIELTKEQIFDFGGIKFLN